MIRWLRCVSATAAMMILSTALLMIAGPQPACAQVMNSQITIGHEVTVHSDALGEDRPIMIHLPVGYETSQAKYPVLYLLDAEWQFAHVAGMVDFLAAYGGVPQIRHIPQMIVVGIPNTNRQRDLTPAIVSDPSRSSYAPAGDSERFITFLDEELVSFIDEHYRTEDYRILAGHCLAGLFTVHNWLADPGAFDARFALTPYLLMDHEVPAEYVSAFCTRKPGPDGFLYVAAGAEAEEWVASIDAFADDLKKHAPDGLRWKYRKYADLGHGAEVHKALYDALETLYEGWRVPDEVLLQGLEAIEKHYAGLSSRFGYTVKPPEAILNLLGYYHLQQGMVDDAVRVFRRNVELYADSWNVYDSLGEAYLARGEDERAILNYRKSLELNPENLNAVRMLERIGSR